MTDVWDGHNPIRLDPLRNFPIVSDLVVDVSGFFQRMSASTLSITRDSEPLLPLTVDDLVTEVLPEPVEPPDNLSHFNRFESCIECGICMSACPTVAADEKFLGPAGLAAIYRARQETDDPEKAAQLLALADGEHGVWRCHSAFECTEACPQGIDVRDGVWRAVFGDFKAVSEMFMDCVMCGLCVPVCIADIAPNLVAVYASRAQGAFFTEKPKRLHERIEEIRQGKYDQEWDKILTMNEQQIKDVCAAIK